MKTLKTIIGILGCIIFGLLTLLFGLTSVFLLFGNPPAAISGFIITLIPLTLLIFSIIMIMKADKKRPTPQNNRQSNRRNLAAEEIPGYTLKYTYNDVQACCWEYVPRDIQVGNRVVLFQEPTNPYDPKAVRLMFVPQRRPFGYLYTGRLQDMTNDYINRGDKVVARVSYLTFQPNFCIKIDMAFYKNKI